MWYFPLGKNRTSVQRLDVWMHQRFVLVQSQDVKSLIPHVRHVAMPFGTTPFEEPFI